MEPVRRWLRVPAEVLPVPASVPFFVTYIYGDKISSLYVHINVYNKMDWFFILFISSIVQQSPLLASFLSFIGRSFTQRFYVESFQVFTLARSLVIYGKMESMYGDIE